MLKTRVLTALALLGVLLAVLFILPPWGGFGFATALMLLAAWEWAQFAGCRAASARLAYVALIALLGVFTWRGTTLVDDWIRLMALAAAWWLVAFLWLALRPHAGSRLGAGLAGALVIVPAWVGLARLLALPGRGAALTLYMLLLIWATDIGGYFAGRRFGQRKLAPAVSPNKTWEGAAGGLALALLVSLAGAAWFAIPALNAVGLGVLIVLASMVGDLTESLFKRLSGLKDSGSLLPGHGGVLDRIDSVTAAVPFFVLGIAAIGLLH